MDLGVVLGVLDDLDEANSLACGDHLIDVHFQIETSLNPYFVKHGKELKDKVILFHVIPAFEHDLVFGDLFGFDPVYHLFVF
jgi:hypothetical protein